MEKLERVADAIFDAKEFLKENTKSSDAVKMYAENGMNIELTSEEAEAIRIALLDYLAHRDGKSITWYQRVTVPLENVDYDNAVRNGEIRKASMLAEIKAIPAKYVSYGDGDLGIAVKKADAIRDIESMAPESIGEGTWYPCDKNGKELTATQLAAAALGASRSEAKKKTARENGKQGGRPKKQKPLA